MSQPKIWFSLLFIIVWIGYAAIRNDYQAESDLYLKRIGRADLIIKSVKDKQTQTSSLKEQIQFMRTDVDAILKRMQMPSAVPSATHLK